VFRTGVTQVVEWAPGVALSSVVANYQRDAAIFAEQDEATHVYKVIAGAVRLTRLLDDGRRYVPSFHFAGDTFGLELGETHRFSAEAIGPCRVAKVLRSAIASSAARDNTAAREIQRALLKELERAQEHALLLGRMSAVERVTMFIREMAQRGRRNELVELPMSRTDIADHLGLTIETVSRTFTQLQKQGVIGLEGARSVNLRATTRLAAA
jgi:CRP/FNR family nitrogen fixation transcriptional regulator